MNATQVELNLGTVNASTGGPGESGGARVGTLAPMTCLSFYPTKPLGGVGDGGAILTDDPERAARWRSIRNCGRGPDGLQHAHVGPTARLDTLQAAALSEPGNRQLIGADAHLVLRLSDRAAPRQGDRARLRRSAVARAQPGGAARSVPQGRLRRGAPGVLPLPLPAAQGRQHVVDAQVWVACEVQVLQVHPV